MEADKKRFLLWKPLHRNAIQLAYHLRHLPPFAVQAQGMR